MEQIIQIIQEVLEDLVAEVQIVLLEDQGIHLPFLLHKVQMVEQVLEQLLQVGVVEVVEDLHKQVKLHKVQMEVMVVTVVDFLLLSVLMVFLVEVIDITVVVAEPVPAIQVDLHQVVLVEGGS